MIATILYIVAWMVLGGFSMTAYSSIFAKNCFFQSSTLLCPATLTLGQKILSFSAVIFMIIAFLFFGRIIWKWFKEQNVPSKWKYGLGFGIIAIALLVVPFGSSDMSYYFAAGRAQVDGLNIYTEAWQMEKDFVYPVPHDTIIGFSYGPIIAHIFRMLYQVSGGEIVWFMLYWKMFMFSCIVVAVLLIKKLIHILGSLIDKKALYAVFLLQPLVLFEVLVNGHFDVLWILAVLAAIIYAHKKRWSLVIPLLIVGVWIKFVPALIAPFFLLWWWQSFTKENWKIQMYETVVGVSLGALVTVAAWYSYWEGFSVFKSVVIQSKWAVLTLFASFYFSLKPLFVSWFQDDAHWVLTRLVHGLVFAIFAYFLWPYVKKVIAITQKKITWSTGEYITAMFVFLLVYLLVWQKSFLPWYGLWFLPFGLILYSIYKNILVFRITRWLMIAPFVYYLLWLIDWYLTRTDAAAEIWFCWSIVAIVFLYPLHNLLVWRKNSFEIKESTAEHQFSKGESPISFVFRQIYKIVFAYPFSTFVAGIFLFKKSSNKEKKEYTHCFIITSVIYPKNTALSYASTRSVYSPEKRYEQTIATINSIRTRVPDAYIICIEAGLESDPFDLKHSVDTYIYGGSNRWVRHACDSSLKSLGEAVMLLFAYKKLPIAERYFKISGRYCLTNDFSLEDWEKSEIVYHYIRPDFISTRLYGFAATMKQEWYKALIAGVPYLFLDYPIEYTLARFTKREKISKIEKVGIEGTDATNGKKVRE